MADDEKDDGSGWPEPVKASGVTVTSGHVSSIAAKGTSVAAGTLYIPPAVSGSPVAPPVRKPLEHVVLPQRLPRRVLVAFLDDEGNPEPFWAAYLAPQDIQVSMSPMDPQDACMDLRLSLVKVFEQ